MSKAPLNLDAGAKLWLGPDFEDTRGGMGKPDIRFFDTAREAIKAYADLGPRRYGARVETADGFYSQDEIEAATAQISRP